MTSGALLFWNLAIVLGTDGLLVGSCLFAWLRGGPAERLGALLYFASALGSGLLVFVTGNSLPSGAGVFVDGSVAVGFLLLALRYNKLWLGAAMLAKGGQLALYATHLTDLVDAHIGRMNLYAASLDVVSVIISVTILVGAIANARAVGRRPSVTPSTTFSAAP